MTSQSRKHRGYATQRIFAEYIRYLFPLAEPTGAGRQGKDILAAPGVHFELKARSGFEPLAVMKQMRMECGNELPIAILRCNGQGEKSVGEWIALTDVDTMLALLARCQQSPDGLPGALPGGP